MTGVNHLKTAEQRLKTCEDFTLYRESYDRRFWDTRGVLFEFLTEQRTTNADLSFEAS